MLHTQKLHPGEEGKQDILWHQIVMKNNLNPGARGIGRIRHGHEDLHAYVHARTQWW